MLAISPWWWWAAAIVALTIMSIVGVLVFATRGKRRAPGSSEGPHAIDKAGGASPAPAFDRTRGRSASRPQGRAEQIADEMRWRAAQQLIDYLGGIYAPDVLRHLVEEMRDPGAAVSRLIELLGEKPQEVSEGAGESRERFLDRLDAFIRLETEIREIAPDANQLIFALLREGRADDVRAWADIVCRVREIEAAFTQIESLAPGEVGLLAAYKLRGEDLSRRVFVSMPPDVVELARDTDELRAAARALLHFAEDWHGLDRRREAAEKLIEAGWDVIDPFCDECRRRMTPLFAKLDAAWKTIASKRSAGLAELRGILDDIEVATAGIESIGTDANRHYEARRARERADAGARGGYRRKAGGAGYGPDGRDRSARSHKDPFQHLWEFFGFDSRPTLAECKAVYRRMMKESHPDVTGVRDDSRAKEINGKWDLAQDVLQGVTA